MNINLSPYFPLPDMDDTLALLKDGDVLFVNGESFDFTGVTDGATLPAGAVQSDYIQGDVSRVNGDIELTIRFSVQPDAPFSVRFPGPLINVEDGHVELPK